MVGPGPSPFLTRAGRRLPEIGLGTFRPLAITSLVLSVLIVATGAAVRLTGSGLGCPDWPSCYRHRLTAQLSFHPVVEFGNRLVTVVIVVAFALTLLAALRLAPRRRDLAWLSAALVGGVIGQAVVGGIVVYTKLNPYLVMVHFGLSMAIVGVAMVLLHRTTHDYGPGTGAALVARPVQLLARAVGAVLVVVVAAGTATTGAGPHAGGSQGQLVAKRLPIALRDMAELHSSLAMVLIGLTLGLAVALHVMPVPERVRRSGRILTVALVAQAGVGYTQYFTHLPAALVEVHVLGATALVAGTVGLFLSLRHRPPAAPGRVRRPIVPATVGSTPGEPVVTPVEPVAVRVGEPDGSGSDAAGRAGARVRG
ncbi:MAG TPA: COX15/CtaA family protein [Acidimicrobiales bacterium]